MMIMNGTFLKDILNLDLIKIDRCQFQSWHHLIDDSLWINDSNEVIESPSLSFTLKDHHVFIEINENKKTSCFSTTSTYI